MGDNNPAEGGPSPIRELSLSEQMRLIDDSGLFDREWYLKRYPDVLAAGMDPVYHYLKYGSKIRRDPVIVFDTDWYLDTNPDVREAQMNPLVHYLLYGAREGRDPGPFFDSDWYLENNPDLKAAPINPLTHYLHHGGFEQRDPSPDFNTESYLKQHPEILAAKWNPLVHFLSSGRQAPGAGKMPGDAPDPPVGAEHPHSGTLPVGLEPSERFRENPESFRPKVSVVVPNYNHASFLRQRLDSIYGQTYTNMHVILLDDGSTDGSREILSEYQARYPDRTSVLFNKTNSGGVYHQWRKGIEAATTDLVWIAESDDYCDPDFLGTLVPFFMDEAVLLAYSRSVFVDEQGRPASFSFETYLSELSAERWRHSYVAASHEEVARYLGRKNTIPNVSSALFRKPDLGPLVRDNQWLSMKVCGDWILYLHLLQGGKIGYSADTRNYFRFHRSNSSAKTYATATYYREHAAVACEIARKYSVPDETLDANKAFVKRFFDAHAREMTPGLDFSDVYDTADIGRCRLERRPNLMIASFAFATGGGEVFPIRLANHLKKKGYPVTFFNFNGAACKPAVREMLRPCIPVVERNVCGPVIGTLLEQLGIEIIHSHHASVDVFFGERCRDLSSPPKHVVTMHGMYETMEDATFHRAVETLADEVSAWIYLADKNLHPFVTRGIELRGPFVKIANGMDPPVIKALKKADYGIPRDSFLVCLASRALPQKGWDKAVEIVRIAREETGIDIHLLLLGDGPVYEEMKSRDCHDFVHLLGFRRNVVDFFAMSDLGLLPTTFEGESFPLCIIECMMAGKPMQATDIGEVRNLLSDTNGNLAGCLIQAHNGDVDVAAAAHDLAALARRDDRYRRRQSLAGKLSKRYELKNIVGAYERVYGVEASL